MLHSTRCKHCKVKFEEGQRGPLHAACIDGWVAGLIAKKKAKQAKDQRARARVEKAQDREKRNKLKPVSKWESECRAIVQKIARIRDKDDGCISCPLPSTWGGQWHGSHYRSVGACSALQFSLWNIHKACSSCNAHKGGNIIEYRPRLVAKVGVERVDWLETQNKVSHLKGPAYIEYLKRFKAVMGRRLRRMEKRAAN